VVVNKLRNDVELVVKMMMEVVYQKVEKYPFQLVTRGCLDVDGGYIKGLKLSRTGTSLILE